MTDQTSSYEGDFVRVATTETPTEAHLLHGVLSQAGLNPQVVGAETVRVWSLMTHALGGVGLMVPQAEEAAARTLLAEYEAGQMVLPGEELARPEFQTLPAPVFNPDRATLLGFVLTPVFPVAVQIVNASVIGPSARRTSHWIWLVVLLGATVATIGFGLALDANPFIVFRSALMLLPLTCFWYIVSGQKQTRMLLATYGPRYRKRTLIPAAIGAAIVAMVLGVGLSQLG